METKKDLYDLKETLTFLKRARDGEFAEIETTSFEYIGAHIEAQYIEKDSQDYYHTYTS